MGFKDATVGAAMPSSCLLTPYVLLGIAPPVGVCSQA